MEKSEKKFLSLTNLLTSLSSQKIVIFLILGLILIGFGALVYKTNIFSSGDTVEVLNYSTETPIAISEIIVEISGSVENPGVFKMKVGDRVDDVLIVSGGLSATADRDWVEKNINRASKLVDGQKIYIYSQSEVMIAKESDGIKLYQGVLGTNGENLSNLVNINTASQTKLEKLNGIGPVYAQKIIDGRIYSNVEELVSKGVISQKVFDKIKNEITVN